MKVLFRAQNSLGFIKGDFSDGGGAFQHTRRKTANAPEPYVTVLVCGKFRSLK